MVTGHAFNKTGDAQVNFCSVRWAQRTAPPCWLFWTKTVRGGHAYICNVYMCMYVPWVHRGKLAKCAGWMPIEKSIPRDQAKGEQPPPPPKSGHMATELELHSFVSHVHCKCHVIFNFACISVDKSAGTLCALVRLSARSVAQRKELLTPYCMKSSTFNWEQ